MATYPLTMASRTQTKKGEKAAMARYMIVYVQNGNTKAQFDNSMNKLMNIQDNLFRFGVKSVQWYVLNRYNEYVCLSTAITNR